MKNNDKKLLRLDYSSLMIVTLHRIHIRNAKTLFTHHLPSQLRLISYLPYRFHGIDEEQVPAVPE